MGGGPTAGRGNVDLARAGIGIGNKLGNGLGRKRRVHDHDDRRATKTRDRRDVTDEIKIKFLVERCVYYVRRTDLEQGIAVRRSTDDHLSGDIGACPRSILDDEWLA